MTGTEMSARSPEPPDEWHVLTASALGASHVVTGQPIQDAAAARRVDSETLVVAVGDGHGNQRHFRSARGSQLAVEIGCEAATQYAAGLADGSTANQIEERALAALVPAIVGRWREAVLSDFAVAPFTQSEQAVRAPGDNELIAYGSTLLLALVWRQWIVLAQIGDGDVVAIRPDGGALQPIPDDPALDGNQTTSLCGPRPEDDFRVRAINTREVPLLGLLVATDGYGNAQAAEPWPELVSADLAEMIGQHELGWFGQQLPAWVSACASADGSGDDTTVALLIAPDAAQARQRAQLSIPIVPPAGSVRIAEPTKLAGTAAMDGEPLPGQSPATGPTPADALTARVEPAPAPQQGQPAQPTQAGQPAQPPHPPASPPPHVHRAAPQPPLRRRPKLVVAASVAVVAVLAVVGIVLAASRSPSHPKPVEPCGASNLNYLSCLPPSPTDSPGPSGSASPASTTGTRPGGQNGQSGRATTTHAGPVRSHLPARPQQVKVVSDGKLAVVHDQLWWCRTGLTHCRELVGLSRHQVQPRMLMCGTGIQVTVDLPSLPTARAAGIRVTFNTRTDLVRTMTLRSLRCP